MENLFFVFVIAAIAFWIGRRSKQSPNSQSNPFSHSPIQSTQDTSEEPSERIAMNGQRAFTLIFMCGWIIAWSAGIYMAATAFLGSFAAGFETIFLGGWLLAAIAGWCFAANTIFKLGTGKPIKGRDGKYF